ncbi:LPXTG cell wall anchor domain-containing protein [Aeromicrobium sp. YIM 150415]|uniref:LPXTG cell wall anchor domain-containing protein n=1 Tax=Aeromicrobium sp. YIM 150415 TaxID=2803912 RepID=UPI0019627906|nr:LPXTG cell wall anchor domain-containing protein [Aeromicrobium sp. YIM 150415]MBM9463366.1 LPXTG cell wall anchor domain-containing protein [Aeromicrobium sp. YIM 150415]
MRTNVRRRARPAIAGGLFAVMLAGGVAPAVAETVVDPVVEAEDVQPQPLEEPVEQEIAPGDEEAEGEYVPVVPEVEQEAGPVVEEVTASEASEAERLKPFAADPPQVTLAQSTLSATKARSLNEGAGLSVGVGPHPEPGEYRILVDGEEQALGSAGEGGQLTWRTLPRTPGTYEVVVRAPSSELSDPVTLTIVADPVVVTPGFTNDRIVQHRGYQIEAEGFAPDEPVSVTALHGFTYTNGKADSTGKLRFYINAQSEAESLGEAPLLTLESPTRKVEQVVERRDPSFQVPQRVSLLDLLFEDVVITGENLPEEFPVTLEIDGEEIDTVRVAGGRVEFWVPGYLEVGDHEVRIYDHVGVLRESTLEIVDAEFETDLTSNIAGRWLDRATHARHGFDVRIEGIEPGSYGFVALLDAEGDPLAITDAEADDDGAVDLELPGEFFEEIEAGDYTVEALFFAEMPMLMSVTPMAAPRVQFLLDDFVLTDLSVDAPETVTQQQLTDGVLVGGMGFQPGEPVTIVVNDLVAGEQLAGADTGVELGLPASIPAGKAEILLVSEAGHVSTTVTVVDAPVAPSADDEPAAAVKPAAVRGRLPATGAEVSGGLLASAALLVLAGAAVLSRQRRRV